MKLEINLPDSIFENFITKDELVKILSEYSKKDKEPVIKLPRCQEGPEIKEVSLLDSATLEVLFHGENVTEILYSIYKDGRLINQDTFKPENNTPKLKLKNKLSFGEHTLVFEGINCDGKSFYTFNYVEYNGGRPMILGRINSTSITCK